MTPATAPTRALVTGSSGFLGRQVARHLHQSPGCAVTGFDLVPPPEPSFPSIQGDLTDAGAVRQACQNVDVVVHLGGVGDVDTASAHPELAWRANVVGTLNLGLAAVATGARVVHVSTWEVYGRPLYDPVDERHPCEPDNVYAASKLAAEGILRSLGRTDGLPVATLRLATAYGPGMRANTVFRRFATAGQRGGPLVVHGDGDQWRQFTHTSDTVRAVAAALFHEGGDLTVNVAAEECVSIGRLAELVSDRYAVPITYAPSRAGEPPPARITAAEARRVLGWRAEVAFDAGVAALLDQLDARVARSG